MDNYALERRVKFDSMPGHRLNFIDIVGGFWKPSQLARLWKSSGDTIVALGSGNPRSRLDSDAFAFPGYLHATYPGSPPIAGTGWTLDFLWLALSSRGFLSTSRSYERLSARSILGFYAVREFQFYTHQSSLIVPLV